MLKQILSGVVLLSALFASHSLCQTLLDAKTCTGVSNYQPVDETNSFTVGQDAYCWLKVSDATVGDHLSVEWYLNDANVGSYDLELKFASMRTYAYRTISAPGSWRVEIKTSAGILLKSMLFSAFREGSVKLRTTEKDAVKSPGLKTTTEGDGVVTILSAKLGTGIKNHEIIGENTTFPASAEHVYCWIKVGRGKGQVINLVWYHNDAKLGEYSLPELTSDGMRTYGYNNIANKPGSWRVEIVGPDGSILKSLSFKVE